MNKNKIKYAITLVFVTLLITSVTVFAAESNTYAQKGAEWMLDGIFWVVLTIAAGYIGMCMVKKNLTGALSTILGSAIALTIIKNPAILESLGTVLNGILGLGGP